MKQSILNLRPLLALCALWFAVVGHAADYSVDAADRATNTITLEQAVRLTLERNPELVITNQETKALEGLTQQAGLLRNPQLNFESEDIGADRNLGRERFTTVRLSQVFELGGKRQARVMAGTLAQEVASQEVEAKRLELLGRVSNAYIEVLMGQRRLELANEGMQLASTVVDTARKRVQAGKVPPVEETKARIAAASAEIEFKQAERDLVAARKRLVLLWREDVPQFVKALGSLETMATLPDIDTAIHNAQQNPLLLRSQKFREQRQAMLELEKKRRIPDVQLSAGYRRFSQSDDNAAVLGVSIPIPVFDRNQGNVQAAYERLQQSEAEAVSVDLRIKSEISSVYESLQAAQVESETLRNTILPAAKDAFQVARRGYELGRFGFLEVLDAQRTLFQNQILYLRALGNYQKLVNELERLMATPLPDRLANAQE